MATTATEFVERIKTCRFVRLGSGFYSIATEWLGHREFRTTTCASASIFIIIHGWKLVRQPTCFYSFSDFEHRGRMVRR